MTDLPTLFEDDFAIIDPATDVDVQFIDYRKRVIDEDRTEPGAGWFFLLPDTDRWKGPFASEAQAGIEVHSELHERETEAVSAAYEAAGFERNLYFGRNAVFRSYHRRLGEETVVIAEAAESLTIYRIPDSDTEIVGRDRSGPMTFALRIFMSLIWSAAARPAPSASTRSATPRRSSASRTSNPPRPTDTNSRRQGKASGVSPNGNLPTRPDIHQRFTYSRAGSPSVRHRPVFGWRCHPKGSPVTPSHASKAA